MTDNERLLKTYVWHRPTGKCFFVSTIERDSSAAITPTPRFNETIAWEYDWDTQERGKIVGMEGEGNDEVTQHMDVVRQLSVKGEVDE
jgi:hypothetical protein